MSLHDPPRPDQGPEAAVDEPEEPGLLRRLLTSRPFSWLLVLGLAAAVLAAAPSDDAGLVILVASLAVLVLAWARGGLHTLGFRRPASWPRLIGLATLAGIALQAVSVFAVEPVVHVLTGESADLEVFKAVEGNLPAMVALLALVWTIVAFGEEILFRGFLIHELERLLGQGRPALAVNVLVSSAIFGAGHLYQGLGGVLVTGLMGALLAIVFLVTKRDLWFVILAHGMVDTVALVLLYLGLYSALTPGG